MTELCRILKEIETIDEKTMAGLLSRFLVNLPDQELEDWNRVFYHLERMWWFYLDHVAPKPTATPLLTNHPLLFRAFCQSALNRLLVNGQSIACELCVPELHRSYLAYKRSIPVAGCAVIRERGGASEVLMVKPAGCASWALPKGKQNFGETLKEAAFRETKEETGIDLRREALRDPIEPAWIVGRVHIFPIRLPSHPSHPSESSSKSQVTKTLQESKNHDGREVEFIGSKEVDRVRWVPLTDQPPPLTQLAAQVWPKLLHLCSSPAIHATQSTQSSSLSSELPAPKPPPSAPMATVVSTVGEVNGA